MGGHTIRDDLELVLAPVVSTAGLDLEGVELASAGRRRVIRVYVDRDGGVDLDTVAEISQAVSGVLDRSDLLGNTPYVLEVSSPGIERPVQRRSDFERFRGYRVKLRLFEGPPRRRYVGTIGPLDGDELLVHVDGQDHRIPLDLVERAHLVLDLDEYQKLAEGTS